MTIRLLAVGDIALCGEYSVSAQKKDSCLPFAQITSLLKQGNIVLGNLEVHYQIVASLTTAKRFV